MRHHALLALLLAALPLSAADVPAGDWPTLGGSATHAGRTAGSVLGRRPDIAWNVPMASAPGALAVAGGRLYLVRQGEVECLTAATGAPVWSRSIPSPNPPTVDGDLLLVASVPGSTGGNQLYALDAATGATRWTAPFTAQWNSYLAPIAADGRVYMAGGMFGGLYGFDRTSGAQRFFVVGLPQTDQWTPVWGDGRLLSWLNGVVRQHDPATGAVQRSLTVNSAFSGYSMGRTGAAVGNRLYVTSPAGLHAIDTTGFTLAWTSPGTANGTPAADAAEVYAFAGGTLRAVRAADGQLLASRDLGEPLLEQPHLTDDAVVVTSSASTFILERGTLALRRTLPIGGRAVLAGGALFLADATRMTLWRLDWMDTAADPAAAIEVTRAGAPISEGASVSGAVRVTVTVRNAIGQHAQIYGNFALLPANEPGDEVDADPWVRTVDVDTRRFLDGENLLSVHLHPHNHHGSGHTTDFTFATFRIVSENANPAANGDRLLPTVKPGVLGISSDAIHGPLLTGGARVDDDRAGTNVEVERFAASAMPIQIIAHLGTSVLGRERWHTFTPPFGDGNLITSAILRPFLRPQPRLARVVYFGQDGAGRANYATAPILLPAATAADVAATPADILHAHALNVHEGDSIVIPDGGTFRLWVKVVGLKPMVDRYTSMSTWIGNRSVVNTPLAPFVAALAPGETSVVVPVDIPASEVVVLQNARQRGEMATAFAVWHDFHQGADTSLERINLPNAEHVHLNSVRTASYPWPYGTPTVVIEHPYDGASFGGGDVELRYRTWGPLAGVGQIQVRLDGGAPIVDTDRDGRVAFTGLPRGNHRITVTLADAQGQPLAAPTASAEAAFTIVNRAPVASGDAWRLAAGSSLTVSAAGVLANDADPDGDPLHAVLIAPPRNGQLALAADGGFAYTPAAGFSGVDTFAYQAGDGGARSRTMVVQLIVLPASPAIPAAWTTWGNGPAHTGRVAGAIGQRTPSLAWSQSSSLRLAQAVIAGGRIYVSRGYYFSALDLRALSASDGTQLWQRPFASGHTLTAPTLVDGTLYLQRGNHASDTQLWAIDAADGSVRWSAPFGAQWEDYLAPCVADGGVFINGGSYGGMYGFTAATGAQRFFAPLAQYDEWTPVHADGRLYSWVAGGFREHDPQTGAVLRQCTVPWRWNGWSMQTAAAIAGGKAVLRSTSGLYAIDLASFTVAWSSPVTSYVGTPAIADGLVYALTTTGLEVRTLAEGVLVQQRTDLAGIDGQPVVADDVVVVSSSALTLILRRDDLGTAAQLPYGGSVSLGEDRLVIAGATALACYAFAAPAPVAAADTYVATAGLPESVAAAQGVLANDTGDGALSAVLVSEPANGTLSLAADGGFTYTAAIGFSGVDSFTYRARAGGVDSAPTTASITVWPQAMVTIAMTGSVAEGAAGPATVIVARSEGRVDVPLTVDLTVGGTAGSADRTAIPTSLVLPAGSTSATFTLGALEDTLVEGPETVSMAITPRAHYRLGSPATLEATVDDNDDRVAMRINFQPGSVGVPSGWLKDEGLTWRAQPVGTYGWSLDRRANAASVSTPLSSDARYRTLIRMPSGATHLWELALPADTYQVRLVSGDPAATTATTQRFTAEGSVVFDGTGNPGSPWVDQSRSVVVSDGRLSIAPSSASGAAVCFIEVQGTAALPIVRITASDASSAEPGTDRGRFTIRRSGPTTAALTVRLARSGSAASGTDFTALPASVTIPAGASAVDLEVVVRDDALAEGTETVVLAPVRETAYAIASDAASATVAIADDGDLPAVTVTTVDGFGYEGGTAAPDHAKFRVARTGPTTTALTVALSTAGTASAGADHTALPAQVVIPAGKGSVDLALTVVDDTVTEPAETVTLAAIAGAGYVLGSPAAATALIVDDEGLDLAINFQPSGAVVPAGFLVDSGSAFAARGNGFSYGWSAGNANTADRNAASSPDQAHDTLIHTQRNGAFAWEIAVPNGVYQVEVVCGDASYTDSRYHVLVEGVSALDVVPTTTSRWASTVVEVVVGDGRLSIANGVDARNNKLCFLRILQVPAGGG